MRRFACLAAMLITLLSAQVATAANPPVRIGIILFSPVFSDIYKGLSGGLTKLGYVSGSQVEYLVANIEGDVSKVDSVLDDFRAKGASLVVTTTTPVALRAVSTFTTHKLPVLFLTVADPVGSGVVKSLKVPGVPATGISHVAFQMLPKRLSLLKECFPEVQRVHTFFNPNESFARNQLTEVRKIAPKLNITLVEHTFSGKDDFLKKAAATTLRKGDAIFMNVDPVPAGNVGALTKLAKSSRVPLMVIDNMMLNAGGAIGYSPAFYDVAYQASKLAKMILGGVAPSKIPVQYPDTIEFVINMKEVRSLNLNVSKECVVLADRIIE